jgi:hypothetical protein
MESSGQHQLQGKETTFQLEHGFIRFVLEEKKLASQNFTGPGKNGEKLRPVFHVHNFNGNKPIFLNPREMMQLAKWLPQIQTLAGRTKLNLDQAAKETTTRQCRRQMKLQKMKKCLSECCTNLPRQSSS